MKRDIAEVKDNPAELKHYWCSECDYYFDSTDFQTANNKKWGCCPECNTICEECE